MWYIFKNNVCIATCDFAPNHDDLASRDEIALESAATVPLSEVLLSDGIVTRRPEPEPTLAEKKAALRAAINAERDRREQGGFEYDGTVFDSDATSVIRINAAVNTAVAAVLGSSEFSVGWTAADNTTVTLDAQGLLGLSTALAAHSNTQHVRARSLKEQLDAAEDEVAVKAVEDLLQSWQQEE